MKILLKLFGHKKTPPVLTEFPNFKLSFFYGRGALTTKTLMSLSELL